MKTIVVNDKERVVADHQDLTHEFLLHLSGHKFVVHLDRPPPPPQWNVTAMNTNSGGTIAIGIMPGQSMGRADALSVGWYFIVEPVKS